MNLIHETLSQTDWLYTRIYQNNLLFIDLWSFVHFWSGFGLIILARDLKIKHPFALMVIILVLYELLEISFLYFAMSVFRPETIKDQFTDIFIGIAGGASSWYALKFICKNDLLNRKFTLQGIAFYAAITIAFIWVGFYRYEYNWGFMNSKGINFWALSWWTIACYVTINLFLLFRNRGPGISVIITYAIYFASLLILEYCGYYLAGMHEISKPGSNALIFGLIHGTRAMHLFYISAPGISILAFLLARWLIAKAIGG